MATAERQLFKDETQIANSVPMRMSLLRTCRTGEAGGGEYAPAALRRKVKAHNQQVQH